MKPRGATVWLTGLPSAGKTTIADAVAHQLREAGYATYRVDGDVLRATLNSDLGFDAASRDENVRRAAHVAWLLADAGLIAVVSLISPYRAMREAARRLHEAADLPFLEVYLDTPLSECERRDSRGLYARARRGELTGVTGVDDPYEPPGRPDLTLRPAEQSVAQAAAATLGVVLSLDLGDVLRLPDRGATPADG